uniref:FXYD domain-containing ion transport regulator n=1 Tax=Sphaeramia orbicularis TaxID=375764 RepID=A0A672ZZB3_9TELE
MGSGSICVWTLITVLLSLLVETEANPFYYNYERLRIGGLVLAGLLVSGGVGVIVYHKCHRVPKKADEDSEI